MRFQTVVSLRFVLIYVFWKAGKDGDISKSVSRKLIDNMYLLCVLVTAHVEIREQLMGAASLLPQCGFPGRTSGYIPIWLGSKHLSLYTEPFHWPR